MLFGFQMWISNVQTLPSDIFSHASIGSIAGMGGTAAGLSSLIFNLCTAWLVTHFGYTIVLTIAGSARPSRTSLSLRFRREYPSPRNDSPRTSAFINRKDLDQ